jgi:hypothetical protein
MQKVLLAQGLFLQSGEKGALRKKRDKDQG